MATHLYETLGLNPDASTEQVRKAYKKKALETHPDRLPPGASAAEKSASEELFRKVNNAYEVLSDPQKRRVYDQHGVFPPATQEQDTPRSRHRSDRQQDTFSDPFFQDPFAGFGWGFGFGGGPFRQHRQQPAWGFTDPFVLFDSIFGDLDRAFRDPFFTDRGFGGGGFPSPMRSMPVLTGPLFGFGPRNANHWSATHHASISGGGGNGGRWVSESRTSRTVNGVTESKWTRRDSSGNEHVTYTYPDGTERATVNGIEQPRSNERFIPPAPQSPYGAGSVPQPQRNERFIPPAPPSPYDAGPVPQPPIVGSGQPGVHHSSQRLLRSASDHRRERRRARDAERAQAYDNGHARPYNDGHARPYDDGHARPYDDERARMHNERRAPEYAGAYNERRAEAYPARHGSAHDSGHARSYPDERDRSYTDGRAGAYDDGRAAAYPEGHLVGTQGGERVNSHHSEYGKAHGKDRSRDDKPSWKVWRR
ncbi:DnaJ-domain-containing protein [Leucogyrophana mollusca]|uniref:DnaJ-domain-containing protein n=1 Tax=Leucogyrophana mollusca TaxID=85980 RepID=A0ACB8BVF6_9AGAM|nr:DnaJ-domain-containing protein [Leucogyrophana mollusca]